MPIHCPRCGELVRVMGDHLDRISFGEEYIPIEYPQEVAAMTRRVGVRNGEFRDLLVKWAHDEYGDPTEPVEVWGETSRLHYQLLWQGN